MNILIYVYIFIFYQILNILMYLILNLCLNNIYNVGPICSYYISRNLLLSSWIILLFYLSYRIFTDNEMNIINNNYKISYKDLKKNAKTGDLIIYRWNTIDIGYRMFSKYSHVSMIIRKKNKLFILETHPNENKHKKSKNNEGVHLYKLKNRILNYDGDCYFTQLNCNTITSINLTNNIMKNIKKYKEIPFDNSFRDLFVWNYFMNLFNIKTPIKNEMFCSEFIGYILKDNKIYNHDKNLTSLNPGSFLHLNHGNNGNLYKNLLKISF